MRTVQAELGAGAPGRALGLLREYPARFPGGHLGEEVEALRAVAGCGVRVDAASRAAGAGFVQARPGSLFAGRVGSTRPAWWRRRASPRARRRIEYLQSLRLATYRYRQAPSGAPPRLGIILEDNEQGIWVDGANDRVDVYGYASLAVATLQLQQRQLTAMQAEIDRLSTQLQMSPVCGP